MTKGTFEKSREKGVHDRVFYEMKDSRKLARYPQSIVADIFANSIQKNTKTKFSKANLDWRGWRTSKKRNKEKTQRGAGTTNEETGAQPRVRTDDHQSALGDTRRGLDAVVQGPPQAAAGNGGFS